MPAASPPAAGVRLAIERHTTVDSVAAALREAILSAAIRPGTALREVGLAKELGVSRNTVREAARILESEGLVARHPNRGVVVADLADADIDDLYAARTAAELAGLDALLEANDRQRLADLAGMVDQLEAAVATGNVAAALDGDRSFHATLVEAAGSTRLSRWHAALQQELRLALSLAERASEQLGRTGDDHRALLDAFEHGSGEDAREALRQHLATGAAELHRLRALLTTAQERSRT